MFEPVVTLGAMVGFIGSVAVNALLIGRYMGSVNATLESVNNRLSALEETNKEQTHILVEIARNRAEMDALTRRVDDLTKHGSHRLSEILDKMRMQIADVGKA